jgi:hypothetical protein
VKNVLGRPDTDKLDAVRLAEVAERGIFQAPFIPFFRYAARVFGPLRRIDCCGIRPVPASAVIESIERAAGTVAFCVYFAVPTALCSR